MIKGSKICGISDLDTLDFIINHPYPPQFIGFIHVLLVLYSSGSNLMAKDRLKLKSADFLERKTIGNKPTKLISGNVVFTKGALTLKCNQGIHFEEDVLKYSKTILTSVCSFG